MRIYCAYIFLHKITEEVENKKHLTGSVVPPSTPRAKDNLYWGYTVRLANTFNAVFTESPYKDGYDLTLGTSERGELLDQLELPNFKLVKYFQVVHDCHRCIKPTTKFSLILLKAL